MQIDQRFIQNIQNQNAMLRQENARVNSVAKTLDEKYQKSLKQMSSIIQANQNLKKELDNLKAGVKDQIENAVKEFRVTYEKKIEQMVIEKNEIYISNQSLQRQKQQLQRDHSMMERNLWENEALRGEIANLKKENEKLLLQTHPLTQNKENPEHKAVEQKLEKKIDELNLKIIELNVENTQSRKYSQSLETEKQKLTAEIASLNKKIEELNSQLADPASQNAHHDNLQSETKALQLKRLQIEAMDLRKQNADLINQVEKLKLQKLQMTSEINKNEAELHLLNTLKTLHAQLEPMRYEIEELKRDKYFQRENTNKEKTETQLKLLSYEHELETQKQYIKDMEDRIKELGQQLREKQWEKNKYQQIEQEKRILEGRVIVYEAMEMVTRNRDKPHHVQRLQQFQRRIQLLLEQENLQYLVNNANVHQLIAMKAYIIELDNKLQVVAEQSEHFHKKYVQYKDKYQLLVSENKQILNKHYSTINAYKGKISGYEKLVIKLTSELERYIKETQGPSDIESHYNSVITLYESKILSIHNEVNAKKQQNRDLLKKYENLEMEHKGKLALNRELDAQVTKLKTQLRQLENKLASKNLDEGPKSSLSSIPEDHYKSIISQKTKQILQLEESLAKLRFKIDKMQFEHDRDLDDRKHKINRLEMEIQHLRLEQESASKQLSTAKHSEEFGELVYKLTSLEKNVAAMSKSQVSVPQPRDSNGDLQRQIDHLRQENKYLINELDNLRNQLRKRVNQQNNLFALKELNSEDEFSKFKEAANKNILQLMNRINQLESQLKIKEKQAEIRNRQIQRKSFDKDDKVVIQIPASVNNNLEQENAWLRTELERMRINYKSMTQESEGLMVKIRQAEDYIAGLKDQFSRVSTKMNEYERELNTKDERIHEWTLKYRNLQQRYETQVTNSRTNVPKGNDREYQERLQKLNEKELEIQRAFREIESKLRDIQRRQMEANRRDSQIDIKNKDLKDRIRKIEDRERIVADQQNRLVRLAQDLDNRQRRIQTTITQPVNTFSPQPSQHSYKQEYNQLQRKMKRLQIEFSEKAKIIQIKDQKMDKLIKQKAELMKAVTDLKTSFDQKTKTSDTNERQIANLKQENHRLEGQLEKLWKQFDILKQQMRDKERQLSDLGLEKQEKFKKYEIEIRQLTYKNKQLENSRVTHPSPPRQPSKGVNYQQLQTQFEQKLKQIEERHKQKVRELYKQNEDSTRDLHQTISDLTLQLNRYRSQSPVQNKSQIEAHTATIQSLESHIKTLEDEVRRKQDIIKQLEEDLKYYQNILAQREEELQKLYESTLVQSSHGDSDSADKLRLQNEIISLQMMLQSKNNENLNIHDECIKKEHLLRMQIERISGILESKMADQASQKPQSPRSQYLDNSYLIELEEVNKNLESDINLLKQRLVANFDNSRSIDEFLTILVLTFAEVDALRQRVYELEQNFKQEHERQINVIKQIDELKEYNIEIQKIEAILKQLEMAHRAFHEQESRSKTAFIKRINTEVIVMPGSQSLSINDEVNRNKAQEQSIIHHITEQVSSSSNRLGSFDTTKLGENQNKFIDYGQRSIKNSLAEDSTIQLPSVINNQINSSSIPTSISTGPSPVLNFIPPQTQFHSQFTSNLPNFSPNITGPRNFNFTSGIGSVGLSNTQSAPYRFGIHDGQPYTKIQFNSGATPSPQFTSTFAPTSLAYPPTFSSLNQPPVSNTGFQPNKLIQFSPRVQDEFSPNKRLQVTQPYQFYQYSEGSQSSLRFPSQTNIASPPSINFRTSETHINPYIMSSNQIMR